MHGSEGWDLVGKTLAVGHHLENPSAQMRSQEDATQSKPPELGIRL